MLKYVHKQNNAQSDNRRKNIDSSPPVNNQNITKKIKNYTFMLNDIIGKGAFSTVYRGRHQTTHQPVAVKVIELKKMQSSALTELLNSEVQTLQSLHHPNILYCHDIYFSASNCYIVTQFCNGGDIKELLSEYGAMDQKSASKIIFQVYEGLRYLSERNIVHRDFKTTNVLINNGRIKIADFGFAKKSKQTFKDVTVGSPLCMSPEGIIHNIYGPKTDVWAFGIFIYELLHRKNPFYFCQEKEELKHAILQPITQTDLQPELSLELKQLILDCLEINPSHRISMKQIQFSHYFMKIREEIDNNQLLISLVEEYKVEKQASIVSTQAPASNQILYRNNLMRQRNNRTHLTQQQSPSKRTSKSRYHKTSFMGTNNINKNNFESFKLTANLNHKHNNRQDKFTDNIHNPRSKSYNSKEPTVKFTNKTMTTPKPIQSKIRDSIKYTLPNSSFNQPTIPQFRDLVSLLHYCRILFKTIKLCQKHIVLNIDGLTSWLFQFLKQTIDNINRIYSPSSNIEELKMIAHQYYVRYDNQLVYTIKVEHSSNKIRSMILEMINILKSKDGSSQNRRERERDRDYEIGEGIRHLEFLFYMTGLYEKALEVKNYKYFTENNEIEEFLSSKSYKVKTAYK